MTVYRQKLRLRQGRWREAHGHPIGRHPIRAKRGRLLGSRLEFEYAIRTGANFLTPGSLHAARSRMGATEPFESLNRDRLWADLLSSMPMAFNLFGDLQRSPKAATRALNLWGLESKGRVRETRFEWSPGRRDPAYLGNQSAFDLAFITEQGGRRGVVGVETKYHEVAVKEKPPSSSRLARYLEVMRRAQVHVEDADEVIIGSDLQQIWLDHLLALSMRDHYSGVWTAVSFVLVYPSENTSFSKAARRYQALLRPEAENSFVPITVEALLGAEGALPAGQVDLIKTRYLGQQASGVEAS